MVDLETFGVSQMTELVFDALSESPKETHHIEHSFHPVWVAYSETHHVFVNMLVSCILSACSARVEACQIGLPK